MAAKVKVKAGKKESNYLEFTISGGEWRVEVLPAGSGLRIIDHETDEAVETIAVPEQWGSQWAWNLLPEGEGVYLRHYRPLKGEGPETPEAEPGDAKNPPTPTPAAEEIKESVEDVVDRLLGGQRMDEEYQGWTNYHTWNANLWSMDDEEAYRYVVDHRPIDGYDVDTAEEVFSEFYPDGTPDMDGELPDDINWQEIADAWNE